MKADDVTSNSTTRSARRPRHGPQFIKVLDGRKQPIRGAGRRPGSGEPDPPAIIRVNTHEEPKDIEYLVLDLPDTCPFLGEVRKCHLLPEGWMGRLRQMARIIA